MHLSILSRVFTLIFRCQFPVITEIPSPGTTYLLGAQLLSNNVVQKQVVGVCSSCLYLRVPFGLNEMDLESASQV